MNNFYYLRERMSISWQEMDKENVTKVNPNTSAVMSSDGDRTIFMKIGKVSTQHFITACYCGIYDSLQD